MHTEINIRRSNYYVNSSDNTFVYVPNATLYSGHINSFRKNMPYMWNELTILWNDLTIEWKDLTLNDLTMEWNDRKPSTFNGLREDSYIEESGYYGMALIWKNTVIEEG